MEWVVREGLEMVDVKKVTTAVNPTVVVFKENNTLLTKVYHKKADQKQYLHYMSSNPRNKKDAVTYGLLIRAQRICSKDDDFKREATSIVSSLLKRGYPDKILLNAFNKANKPCITFPRISCRDGTNVYLMGHYTRQRYLTFVDYINPEQTQPQPERIPLEQTVNTSDPRPGVRIYRKLNIQVKKSEDKDMQANYPPPDTRYTPIYHQRERQHLDIHSRQSSRRSDEQFN